MNQSQLLNLIENYFQSIGANINDLNNLLNLDHFQQASIKRLPNVCIRRHNRNTTSNQSHIHITGNDRFVFYDTISHSTDNERINVSLINANLLHLQNMENERRNHFIYNTPLDIPEYSVDLPLGFLQTHTNKKIARRTDSDYQVQISNIELDGAEFVQLRNATFTGDILVFLQQIDDPNHYVTLVIPNLDDLNLQINNRSQRILFEENLLQNNQEDRTELLTSRNRFYLNEVTSQNIANFSRNTNDNSDEFSLFDLAAANELRAERTERHQFIVRELAIILENSNMRIFEGNIDCLAIKENEPPLIFEVKTLNGSATDESSQVRKALSQLLYYERFAIQNFIDHDFYKFVVFEHEVSREHVEFLEEYNCFVLYYSGNSELSGSEHALQILNLYLSA